MVSTTAKRPTHYDMLGVEPDATADEIARAFAREIGMFRVRPVGGLAEVGIAYETLRDPAKRRAYDVAIALVQEPPAPPATADWAPFMMRAAAHPVERRAVDPLHRPARQPEPEAQVRPEAPVDPRLAAIAASVRELAKPVASVGTPAPTPNPEPRPTPQPEPLPLPEPDPKIEERLSAEQSVPRVHLELADDFDAGSFEWKRPVVIGGGLVAAVALIGAWAGVKAGNDAQAQTLESRVTTSLPQAKPAAPAEADSNPLMFAEASPSRRSRAAAAHRQRPKAPRALSAKELDELAPLEVAQKPNQATDATAVPAVAEAAPAPVTQARMPLPNSVIARTIGRIGYPCGSVASTAQGGAPGVFTVTCTSGHSYRAAPVRGRYHFSRLSSR